MEFLCVIVCAQTNKSLAEYEVEANNEPFATWKAAQLFSAKRPDLERETDWTVDTLRLD